MSTNGKRSSSIKRESSTSKGNSKNNLADMFEFFARIAKLVILRKDDTDVVSKYSTWLKKLKKHSNDKLKYDYIKLLVMGLNHPVPVCPFNDYPPEVIDPLEGDWIVNARNIFYNGDPSCRPIVLNPPIATAVSDDKCQFAAYQEIPNAGLQCYYAQSDEPLYEWFFKQDSLSIPPENPVQAIPLDWERSLAGIHVAPPKVPSKKKTSSSLIQRPSTLSVMGSKVEPKRDFCKILETIQEMFNITAQFKWTENTLLTGDTIPGSDLCIDWFIHEHERTQLDIDDEMIRSFDKIYPHNFRLTAKPELLEGIVRKMDCVEEKAKCMEAVCARVEEEDCKYQ